MYPTSRASKQFYSEKLGWKLVRRPEVAGFYFGSGYLVLVADSAHTKFAGGNARRDPVSDIDAEYGRLVEAGVAVSELRRQPWGERNFSFHDPDGYEWSYGEIESA
jgi:catechol 2,3-dioxygenase-like lactoylglutathione lyase family enzyme